MLVLEKADLLVPSSRKLSSRLFSRPDSLPLNKGSENADADALRMHPLRGRSVKHGYVIQTSRYSESGETVTLEIFQECLLYHDQSQQRSRHATGQKNTNLLGAIHSTKISGNFGPRLNGSVRSNRKSFEKTGPPFEVDHFSRSDRLEFWLNGSRPMRTAQIGPDLRLGRRWCKVHLLICFVHALHTWMRDAQGPGLVFFQIAFI